MTKAEAIIIAVILTSILLMVVIPGSKGGKK